MAVDDPSRTAQQEPGPAIAAFLADQRRRAAAGEPLRVEYYLVEHPGLRRDPRELLALIENEIALRRERGESVALAEYADRFPEFAGQWKSRAIGESPHTSTEVLASSSSAQPDAMAPVPQPGWPTLAGHEITGELGSGGMGLVYRARDRERGSTVAVKTMRWSDPVAIYRFKQEFRALLGVSHPNLASLYELISDGRNWYLVMEYIDGTTFLRHVREGPAGDTGGVTTESAAELFPTTRVPGEATPATTAPGTADDEELPPLVVMDDRAPLPTLGRDGLARLRDGLVQLAEGLDALHRAGRLHRDIKPANVMVTRQGRVVLMDFGLVSAPGGEGADESTEGHVMGTPAYMAPEQAAGEKLTPAADWYAVGVMIYEALTGRLPFSGPGLAILMEKQRREPPAPRTLNPDAPADLDALCVDLLRIDPLARPSGTEILARLATRGDRTSDAPEPPTTLSEPAFVGRASQRASLADALTDVSRGGTVVVFLHGPSGVGKSALIRTFLAGLTARGETVVLSGRCYERESVPYKALDSLIDALCRHLRHLPSAEAAVLLPRDVGPLARIFPVLGRVEAIREAPRREAEVPDPQELRRRAQAGLRELLARLGDRRPLVLAIDDLQWADADSLAVLAEVLRPPDAPALLLLACYRSEGDAVAPPVRSWLDVPGADRRDLAVGPLSLVEARALARELLAGPSSGGRADAVARESGGNPLFVAELARAGDGEAGTLALDEVLWGRVNRLPAEARSLLEVVAVSGGPTPAAVAWRCLDRVGDDRDALALLRHERLIRAAGGSPEADRIETYHDRIRETVTAHLPGDRLAAIHRRLASALEAAGAGDDEELGVHLRAAGETRRAGAYFARAADRAADALAFDRAAALYRAALEVGPAGASESQRLRAALAGALANAGRGAEAASAYLSACEGATVAEALDLRRRAAMQFLISGHIDAGLSALGEVLHAIGLRLPRTPRKALASLLWQRARLLLRGLRFRPRDTSELSAADLTRIDVCWSAGVGLGNVDWILGAGFQARGLLLALRAGEPYRVARALAVEAAQTATAGQSARRRTALLLGRAATLAKTVDQPYALGMVALAEGVSAYLECRWGAALEACDRAEGIFRDRCTGVAWELDTAHAYSLWALSHLGRWSEMIRRFPVLMDEARDRGDLYASMNLSTYVLSIVRMAADDPLSARDEVARVAETWSRRGYHVQHNDQIWASAQVDLYLGEGHAAWDRVLAHWPTLSRSMLLRVQFIRVAMLGLRGRCALAHGKESALKDAGRQAARLDRERLPWASAQAHTLRAGLAAQRSRKGEAIEHLRQAASLFRGCEMPLCACVADRRVGSLIGGAEGAAIVSVADAHLASESVRNPGRIAELFAPGFAHD